MINTTTRGHWQLLHRTALSVAVLAILVLAGCSSAGGAPSSGAGPVGSSGTTVMVHNAAGHADVIASADGRTLYVSDQEDGTVLCKTSDCTAIWLPLTVDAGKVPTGPSQLSGKLGTVVRPDGKTQVTFGDKPLYTFSFDHKSGEVGGDGQKDSFGGTDFTWHVATASGSAPAPASPSDGGYNY
jgi:predicted lipoprotein with Yx(FWY)xxD motif